MNFDDIYYIGILSKKIGFKGELIGVLDVDDPEKYSKLESVFLSIEDKLIPFFIDKISIRPNSNQATIKFSDIDNEEKADRLINREMYLPLNMLPPLSGNDFYFHEVKGFDVYDSNQVHIGKLLEVIDYPGNPLMQIKMQDNKKEALIPAIDEFILEVDRNNKKMIVDIPEGLLDIF